ncbi:MAG TPA: PIN domain-containing protein [Thermoanaerobaculia bacterium]
MAQGLPRGHDHTQLSVGHVRRNPRRGLSPSPELPGSAPGLTFLKSGAVTVLPITDDDLPDIEALMERYRDRPMDFADATLVHLARREALTTVFTADHDDFETYRIEGKQRFRIVPDRS